MAFAPIGRQGYSPDGFGGCQTPCPACGYGLRAWIEQGFKKIKGGGWQWHSTRMTDPARVERLWLAIVLATW